MTNIRLTYDYTRDSVKTASESIDKLNTKLTVVLTFGGALVNFSKDLPGYNVSFEGAPLQPPCISCYLFQVVAFALVFVAIAFGLWGILPAKAGRILLPTLLLEDSWNNENEEVYMTYFVQELENTLMELDSLGAKKSVRLNYAIRTIGGAILILILDKILSASLPVMVSIWGS
jgi:hypothetical protein